MSTKRMKSLSADDDDLYDDDEYGDEFGDEEELSAEDKEQLRLGTIKVRENLGPAYNVPEKDIHDALWNYYYDIPKTLSFLKNKHKSIPSKSVPQKKEIKPAQPQRPKDKPIANISNGIAKVSIAEAPRIKSKNLDVVAEYQKSKRKKAANFVVIGHVDAGKSTLMGRLLFDLKAIDQRTIDKYKREAESIGKGSFAFAWVLDQGSEERARGVTMDIAQNSFSTSTTNFTILDAPGHRDFVPNMIAGASQADFAVLVIDASTGNFESGLRGQTKEHAILVRALGVQRLIVAVNKMDMASWAESRFQEIQSQLSAFLASAGYAAEKVVFIPCSGLQGDNILTPTTDPRAAWYKDGPTLVSALESSETPSTFAIEKPLRLTIADVFRGGVTNPLSISGRIEAGSLQIGETVLIQPSGETAAIKGIEADNDIDSPTNDTDNYNDGEGSYSPPAYAVAGQNTTLHLLPLTSPAGGGSGTSSTGTADKEPDIRPGDVLCSPTNSPIQVVSKFTVKLVAFEHLTPMLVDVHRGRLHKPGRIVRLIETLDRQSGGVSGTVLKRKPRVVMPGSWVRVVVEFGEGDGDDERMRTGEGAAEGGKERTAGKGGPVAASKEKGVPLENGNRVVLRANGVTVAAGVVE